MHRLGLSLVTASRLPLEKHPELLDTATDQSEVQHPENNIWWVWEDLNFRPHPYQGCALTN